MANPLYPTTPVPDQPYVITDTYKTLSSPEFDSGKQTFKQLRNYPRFNATLTYGSNPSHFKWSDIWSLYSFFVQMKGSALTFDFIDFNGWDSSPIGIQWPNLYIGVGTGATTSFDVPMTSSSSFKLYNNGVDITNNLWVSGAFNDPMWKFHAGAGANGRDNIEFYTAPLAGHILEWYSVGQRVVVAHFNADVVSLNAFSNMLASTGLAIQEVK